MLFYALQLLLLVNETTKTNKDGLPEWSKGMDSGSTGASLVGSNATAVSFLVMYKEDCGRPSQTLWLQDVPRWGACVDLLGLLSPTSQNTSNPGLGCLTNSCCWRRLTFTSGLSKEIARPCICFLSAVDSAWVSQSQGREFDPHWSHS